MDRETSEREALLPCPFCGKAATLGRNSSNGSYYVHCAKNDCDVEAATLHWKHEADAIVAWNRRAQPASVPEDVRDAQIEKWATELVSEEEDSLWMLLQRYSAYADALKLGHPEVARGIQKSCHRFQDLLRNLEDALQSAKPKEKS